MAATLKVKSESDRTKTKGMNKLGKAVFGCFLRNGDKQGPILAMVCRHVTKVAEGLFYVDKECKIPLAQIIDKSSCYSEDLTNDVDLVQVTEHPELPVKPIYRNVCGKEKKMSLFIGTVTELKNARIFQCCRSKKEKQGRVLEMSNVPESLLSVIDFERNFIVDDINGESFAKEGDSGRVVAREKDGGIELVGIVTWGQYQCHDSPGKCGNLSICMLLKYAIEYLNKKYRYSLNLLEPITGKSVADVHDDAADEHNNTVEPGQTMFFPLQH